MRILLQAALLTSIATTTLAQNSVPSDTTLHTTTSLVVVPTLVETPAKQVVYSLTADDFALTDNTIPQTITLERAATEPLSLIVLMQTGGSARGEFVHYAGVETMLESLLQASPDAHAPNQVAIVNFDSRPEAASPFTPKVAEWKDAIDHPDPGDSGAAILDGLAYALRLLQQQPATNRRAILLISQPTDSGSKTTLKEILRTTAETNTTIYTLTFSPEKAVVKDALKGGSGHANAPLAVGPINPANATVVNPGYQAYFDLGAPLALILGAMRKNFAAEIATLTGGEAARFDDQQQLDDSLSALATHIRNRYLITFQPTVTQPGLHTLGVHVPDHPDLLVSARTNYWAATPDPANSPSH
jgi:VWFA-related protein